MLGFASSKAFALGNEGQEGLSPGRHGTYCQMEKRLSGRWDASPHPLPERRSEPLGVLPSVRPQLDLPSRIVWAKKTALPGRPFFPGSSLYPLTDNWGNGRPDFLAPSGVHSVGSSRGRSLLQGSAEGSDELGSQLRQKKNTST